jgi:type VI secretion system protein ImpC
MAEDRSGGIASFGVGFGERPTEGERAEPAPFRVVVVAELVAGPDWSTGRAVPLEPIPIDAESFDRVMGALAPSLAIDVKDPFAPRDPPLRVDLILRDRKALRPNEIVQQVPALRALVAARQVVQDVTARKLSADAAANQLSRILPRPSWVDALVRHVGKAPVETPPERAPQKAAAPQAGTDAGNGDGLSALLDMVETAPEEPPSDAPAPPSGGELSRVVAAVARSARPELAPRAGVGSAPQLLEQAFGNLLASILEHPEVRRLEATWRGLRLLAENVDRRRGVEVDVLCAGPDDVDRALDRLAQPDSSRAPVDLIVIDQRLDPNAADLERLERWGSRAAELLAPLLVAGGASMLGVDSLGRLAGSTSSLSTIDEPRAAAVRAVAGRDPARWIAVVLNDPLLRGPYTRESSRQQQPAFEQDPGREEAHVFGNGGYLVAALCARSHARSGWPTAITGARDGVLGDLPVHTISHRGNDVAIPLRAVPTEDVVKDSARAGLTLLACAPNSDAALLSRAPVLHRGARGEAPSDATLSDQLFVGRFARALQQIASAIPRGTEARKVEEVTRIALGGLFETAAPPGPELAVRLDQARDQVTVTVRPRRFAGVQMEEITLGAVLGG